MFYLAFDWIDVLRPRVKLAQGAGRELENQPVFEDQEPEWFLSDGSRYQQTKARDFTFWLILSLKIFLVFLIGYAAMYNGINSLDQVIFAMCIGYALFCIFYYYFKDGYCVDLTKISEKMGPFSSTLSVVLVMTVFYSLLILGAKLMYNWQVDGFTVNPRWKSEHLDVCGKLPYPSFFEKELLFIYRFIYLNLGIYFGMTFDALALGGTRIDYNQMRESEGRSPLVGFLVRFIVTIGWILLNLWGLQYVLNLVIHEWLFVLAIPYFLCTFGMFSILKYPFLLLGATKNEIYPIPETSAVELRKAERPTAQ